MSGLNLFDIRLSDRDVFPNESSVQCYLPNSHSSVFRDCPFRIHYLDTDHIKKKNPGGEQAVVPTITWFLISTAHHMSTCVLTHLVSNAGLATVSVVPMVGVISANRHDLPEGHSQMSFLLCFACCH